MAKKRSFDLTFKLRAVAYAKEHSDEEPTQHFGVSPKCFQEWCKQDDIGKTAAEKRPTDQLRNWFTDGGTKKASNKLAELVWLWIIEQRPKGECLQEKESHESKEDFFKGLPNPSVSVRHGSSYFFKPNV